MNINNELYLLHLLQKQINEKYNKQKFMVGLRKKKNPSLCTYSKKKNQTCPTLCLFKWNFIIKLKVPWDPYFFC